MNGVGYNTTAKVDTDNITFVGASFENVGEGTFIPFSAITCVEGFSDGDQFQKSYMDGTAVNFKIYEYWDGDGWADPDTGDILDPDFAINTPGKGFWYITADPENVSFTEVSPLAD